MLFDDVSEALPGLRAQAESLMVDRCTVSWQAGSPVLNEDTGQLESPSVTVGPFPCQVLMPGRDAREGERGAHEYVQGVGELKLPVTVTDEIPAGAVATVTASSIIPTGTELRIVFERTRTLSTARRFAVEVTTWRG